MSRSCGGSTVLCRVAFPIPQETPRERSARLASSSRSSATVVPDSSTNSHPRALRVLPRVTLGRRRPSPACSSRTLTTSTDRPWSSRLGLQLERPIERQTRVERRAAQGALGALGTSDGHRASGDRRARKVVAGLRCQDFPSRPTEWLPQTTACNCRRHRRRRWEQGFPQVRTMLTAVAVPLQSLVMVATAAVLEALAALPRLQRDWGWCLVLDDARRPAEASLRALAGLLRRRRECCSVRARRSRARSSRLRFRSNSKSANASAPMARWRKTTTTTTTKQTTAAINTDSIMSWHTLPWCQGQDQWVDLRQRPLCQRPVLMRIRLQCLLALHRCPASKECSHCSSLQQSRVPSPCKAPAGYPNASPWVRVTQPAAGVVVVVATVVVVAARPTHPNTPPRLLLCLRL
jgi:hypothetical protein